MLKKLFISCWQIFKLPLLVFFIYATGFVLAFTVARPFYVTILDEAKRSISLDVLVTRFDFMYFTDFLRVSKKALTPFLPFIFGFGVLYYFLSIFFSGGILATISTGRFKLSEFLSASSKSFGRFLLSHIFSILFGGVLVLVSILFFVLFTLWADGGNERTYFFALLPPAFLLAFLLSFVLVQSDYAKVFLFHNPSLKPAKAFGKSILFVWKHPSTLAAFWLTVVLGFLALMVYLCLDEIIGMHSAFTIFLMFIIQQAFVFFRTFLKILNLGFANFYLFSIPNLNILLPIEKIEQNLNLDGENAV